jgi:phosphate transport system substrate-binding protein
MVEGTHDAKTLAPGTVVGAGYRVLRPLAQGGMGTVYEVEQVATGARRALKVMHGEFASDPGLRARFVREARLAAEIASDHVAQVLDAGDDQATGSLYIVMELLDGATLSRELRRRGAFAWADVLEIVRQIAHGLGAAHARGFVHRDLKPANVFLSRSRHAGLSLMVKVLDFGIAKAMAGGGEATRAILGTPAWMAPEQTAVEGEVGPQADVWALGLLAFMLLAGRHYFPSATVKNVSTAAVLREVVLEPIIPASERAAQLGAADRLPAGFDAWFARCVHRNAERRFPDASAAYEALAALSAPSPAEPAPVPLVKDPPPSSAAGLDRPETPVTAIESPHASRASRARRPSGAPSARSAVTRAAMGSRFARTALAVIGGLAAVVAVALLWRRGGGQDPALSAQAQAAAQSAAVSAGAAVAATSSGVLVRLHGSNTIGAELGPALAEAFLQRRTGARSVVRRRSAPDEIVVEARDVDRVLDAIEIHAHGSATAFEDLGAGRCDIGMSSRRIHEDEAAKLAPLGNMASAASEHVIALDGIAVVVNPTNPVTTLTKAQIADVFAGKLRTWSDVGGGAQPIALHARDDKSGTFDTFKHMVLGARPLASSAVRYESSEALSDAVAEDARAIGFIGLPYVRSAKAVLVQDGKAVPLLPSPTTVATEEYPLARRLYLYVPIAGPSVAREFVDFVLSEEGQRAVQAAGFVDLRPRCDQNAARCTSCTREYRDAVRGACRLSLDFRFDPETTQLDTRALSDLQRIVAMMARPESSGRSIVLLGFDDAKDKRSNDVARSVRDATVVATQLRARGLHVEAVKGLGPDMPVSEDTTDEGRERNRRVEVWLR